jgi:dipeptidyl aminopeptidase/acylaminoacyl peptidase
MSSSVPAGAAQAQPVTLIPRDVLFGNPERAAPQISPDGKFLAYLAPVDGVLNVWVRSTADGAEARAVTSDRKRGIQVYLWQADSRHVLYIQDKDGDENWHVYQTTVASGETRDLTPSDGVQAQLVAHDHRFPSVLLAALNIRDKRLHDVYRIDLTSGTMAVDTENPGDVVGWNADNALQVRAATAATPDGGSIIRVRDTAKSAWRDFQKWGPDETFGGVVGFTPDNRSIWLISSVDANASRLVEADLATGASKVVAEDLQYDVNAAITHPETNQLQAVQFVRARSEWQTIDKSIDPDFAALRKVRDGDLVIASRSLDDTVWLVSFVEDDAPIYSYVYERATKKATLLFSNRPKLEQYSLAPMSPVSFKARDGLTIHGYLTLPVGVEPKNLPMVLDVHGGPWARDVWGWNPEVQWLANRGYAVLQVNFRGSTGYGKAFLNAGDREWGNKMHHDLLDAKAWAVSEGYADAKKTCIYGGSYGGYAVLAALAFTPDAFACGVDIVGPSNIVTLIKSIPPYWAPLKAVFDKRVGNIEKEEEFLKGRSPLFKAADIKAPLLIAQGANDPRVKQPESDQIVEAMRKSGKPVEYLVFPDEGHGFARPENRLKFYAAGEAFLAKYLGGRSVPPAGTDAWDGLKK